jgi:hypothetical protein
MGWRMPSSPPIPHSTAFYSESKPHSTSFLQTNDIVTP